MTKYIYTIFIFSGLFLTLSNIASAQEKQTIKKNDRKYETSTNEGSLVYKTEDTTIQKLSKHIYQHVSFQNTNDYGKVPCNGMIIVNGNEAIVFDTPTNNQSAKELIDFVTNKLKHKIVAVIPTHFHSDSTGGLESFIENNIPVYTSNRTIKLLNNEGKKYAKPLIGFDDKLTLKIGSQKVSAQFFGEGHTKDNFVGYFPKAKAVFGGCLIKEVGAGKGYLDDANVKEWSETVRKIKIAYPKAKIVIPGHGKFGGTELFDYTIKLFD